MKLLSLHIENFGCFSERDYDFSDGLNSVLEDNGYGKSTLSTFIAVMFYGFFDEKGKLKSNGLRAYYKPWQGGNFGGTLDFTFRGTDYRIQRTFGKRPADDEMRVYRMDTRMVTEELGENPGLTLFSVDGESFLRTVFIRDNDCHVELTDGVHSKIGGFGADAMDMNRFRTADERLKDELNRLSPTRATGLVKKLRTEAGELNRELQAKEGVEEAAMSFRADITALREERKEKEELLSEVRKKQEILSGYQTTLADRTTYEGLIKETEARKFAFEEATRKFPGEVPTKEVLSGARQNLSEFSKYEELKNGQRLSEAEKTEKEQAETFFKKSELFSDDEDRVKELLAELREKEALLETEKKDKEATEESMKSSALSVAERIRAKRKARKVLLLSGVVLVCFGVLSLSLHWFDAWKPGPVFAFSALGVGAVMFIVGLILQFTAKGETVREEELPEYSLYLAAEGRIQGLESEIGSLNEKLAQFFARFDTEYSEKDALLALSRIAQAKKDLSRLKAKETAYGDYEAKAAAEKGSVTGMISRFGFASERPLGEILTRMETLYDDYEDTKREYLRAQQKASEFEKTHDVEAFRSVTAPAFLETMTELNEAQKLLSDSIQEISRKILQYEKEIDNRETALRDLQEKEEARDEKLILAGELAEKHRLLDAARTLLTSAKLSLTAKYQNPVEEHLKEYVGIIAKEGGPEFLMDAEGELKVRAHGDMHDVESLSHGYRDLAGFALRLSLIDAMYKEEKPPVLLDDPFVNLDEKKLTQAKRVVSGLAEKYQVLYFTCHESRSI